MANTAAVTFSTIALGALGYCLWFDFKRRNDPEFRRQLKQQVRSAEKAAEKAKEEGNKQKVAILKQKLTQSLLTEPLPTNPAQVEQFFMEQVGMGEKLAVIVGKEIDAAVHFYKALAIYPNPTSILEIYQKSVTSDIYELIIMLTAILPPASVSSILNGSSEPAADEQD
ncbi:Tom20 protein [Martiniozyma asiatica (nom. inval.)]|nr:Tom20 protein [Martiniozyma asiatica]